MYNFIFDQNNQLIDVRTPKDMGSPPKDTIIINIKNPTQQQLNTPWQYQPSPNQKGLIKKLVKKPTEAQIKTEQHTLKQQLAQVLLDWQNRIALAYDYRSIDQAVFNDETFKQWDIDVRKKAIFLKNQVESGNIPLETMSPSHFINQLPKLKISS